MATCSFCGQDMSTGASCTVEALHLGGGPIRLAPFRGNGRRGGTRCSDCGVRHGGFHHLGCDLQPCPRCAGQLFGCDCRFDEDLDEGELDDPDQGPWGPDPVEITVPAGGSALFGGQSIVEPLRVDGNGVPGELHRIGGMEVVVHIDDVPDSDWTVVDGIRCTTPLRTVIDLAPQLSASELRWMVDDCLNRGLFTDDDAHERLARPDMQHRAGALLLRQALADR